MRRSCKRHYTRFPSSPPPPPPPPPPPLPSPHFEFLQLCAAGSLPQALRLLNSADDPRRRGCLPTKPLRYASLLQASARCRSFSLGLQLHSHLVKTGLDSDRFVGNSLLSLYFKLCPDFAVTRQVFDALPVKDVISWTSMVSGYVRAGRQRDSLRAFVDMSVLGGVEPNAFTLSAAVKACSDLMDGRLGRCFHAMALVRGYEGNHVIASALVDMYGRSLAVEDATQLFAEMHEPDAICWTSVISALTRNDQFQEALNLFYLMMRNKDLSMIPDEFTFGILMTTLGNLGRARQGKEAHAKIVTSGFSGNVVVESSTVDMYAKCGLVKDSQKVFDRMSTKNAVSWCALLGGYCQNGKYKVVLHLFREMDKEDDRYSLGTILRACAGLAAVKQGKEVHCRYLRTGGYWDVIVESALIDLYAKCGLVDYAYFIFSNMPVRNLITWNALICGSAQNGRGGQAIGIFEDMVSKGVTPDYISFIGVMFACSHGGLVEQGKNYFKLMKEDYGITPGVEHYSCIVDLLSRAGLLEEAEDLINNATCRGDYSLWAALLGACATHSNMEVAERVAKKMMELEPQYHLSYVLIANVYKKSGRWNEALEIWKLMKERGVKKDPGKSWMGANRATSSYFASAYLCNTETEDNRDSLSDTENTHSF